MHERISARSTQHEAPDVTEITEMVYEIEDRCLSSITDPAVLAPTAHRANNNEHNEQRATSGAPLSFILAPDEAAAGGKADLSS
jgi:hypothetical protein